MPTVKIGSKTAIQVFFVPLSEHDERHLRSALAQYIADEVQQDDPRALIVRALEAYTDSTWAGVSGLLARARTWSKRKSSRVLRYLQAGEGRR